MSPRLRALVAWGGIGLCVLYLANPGAGIFEMIPDNIPVIGNLDEVGATMLLVRCWRLIRSL